MPVAPGEELLPETRRALLHRVATGQADGRAPLVTAGVVRGGRLPWWGSRSMPGGREPDAGTQYRIGSISKALVAIMVMRLRDEGLLDLADPLALSRYRPEADGTWTAPDDYYAGETLRLMRRADGAVDHLDVGTFVFTREPYPPDAPDAAQPDPDGWRAG